MSGTWHDTRGYPPRPFPYRDPSPPGNTSKIANQNDYKPSQGPSSPGHAVLGSVPSNASSVYVVDGSEQLSRSKGPSSSKKTNASQHSCTILKVLLVVVFWILIAALTGGTIYFVLTLIDNSKDPKPTESPALQKFTGTFTLPAAEFDPALSLESSDEYQQLHMEITESLDELYSRSSESKNYISSNVVGFSEGSVIVEYLLYFRAPSSVEDAPSTTDSLMMIFQNAVNEAQDGEASLFADVDPSSIVIEEVLDRHESTTVPLNTVTPVTQDEDFTGDFDLHTTIGLSLEPDTTTQIISLEPDTTTQDISLEPDTTTQTISLEPDTTTQTISLETDTITQTISLEPDTTTQNIPLEPDITTQTISLEPDTTTEAIFLEPDTTTQAISLEPDATTQAISLEPDTTTQTISLDPDTTTTQTISLEPDTTTQTIMTSTQPELKPTTFTAIWRPGLECGTRMMERMQRIIGGQETQLGKWPWLVSLQSRYGHYCGAAIIGNIWILTAAHCTYDRSVQQINVFLNSTIIDHDDGYYAQIDEIYMHPDYNDDTLDYDIAVLRLSRSLVYSDTVSPICLETIETDNIIYDECFIAGWGNTDSDVSVDSASHVLLEANVPVIPRTVCDTYYIGLGGITQRMICAGFEEGEIDSCSGDSGGPLMCPSNDGNWYVSGVTSWGIGCAQAKRPGVYANVPLLTSWVFYTMQNWYETQVNTTNHCTEITEPTCLDVLPYSMTVDFPMNNGEYSDYENTNITPTTNQLDALASCHPNALLFICSYLFTGCPVQTAPVICQQLCYEVTSACAEELKEIYDDFYANCNFYPLSESGSDALLCEPPKEGIIDG